MPEETCSALVVSASDVLRETIATFIVQSDLGVDEVFCASNRTEAAQICRRIQVDILVAEDLLQLRRGEGQPAATLIVGPPSADKIQQFLDRGASAYLVKPFSRENLAQEVRLALAGQAAAGQAMQVS